MFRSQWVDCFRRLPLSVSVSLTWRRQRRAGLWPGWHGNALRQRVVAHTPLRPGSGTQRSDFQGEEIVTSVSFCREVKPAGLFSDDLQRLGVASGHHGAVASSPRSRFDSLTHPGSGSGEGASGLGALEQEDKVDSQGTRWRCFSTGDPPQRSRVNMSVLEPFLRVLSHGGTLVTWCFSCWSSRHYLKHLWKPLLHHSGYYGDGMNDIIVFSSCYLPQNSQDNYQYVMDNLFRWVS